MTQVNGYNAIPYIDQADLPEGAVFATQLLQDDYPIVSANASDLPEGLVGATQVRINGYEARVVAFAGDLDAGLAGAHEVEFNGYHCLVVVSADDLDEGLVGANTVLTNGYNASVVTGITSIPFKDLAASSNGNYFQADDGCYYLEDKVSTRTDEPEEGGYVVFNGSDNYIPIANSEDILNLKINFWIEDEVTPATTYYPLGSMHPTQGLIGLGSTNGALADETISLWGNSSGFVTYIRENIPAGWNELELSWNGSSYDFILNGVQLTTYQGIQGHCELQVGNIYVGKRESFEQYFTGRISSVIADGIVHLPLDEKDGLTCFDVIGDNDGYIQGTVDSSTRDTSPDVYSYNNEFGKNDGGTDGITTYPSTVKIPASQVDPTLDAIDNTLLNKGKAALNTQLTHSAIVRLSGIDYMDTEVKSTGGAFTSTGIINPTSVVPAPGFIESDRNINDFSYQLVYNQDDTIDFVIKATGFITYQVKSSIAIIQNFIEYTINVDTDTKIMSMTLTNIVTGETETTSTTFIGDLVQFGNNILLGAYEDGPLTRYFIGGFLKYQNSYGVDYIFGEVSGDVLLNRVEGGVHGSLKGTTQDSRDFEDCYQFPYNNIDGFSKSATADGSSNLLNTGVYAEGGSVLVVKGNFESFASNSVIGSVDSANVRRFYMGAVNTSLLSFGVAGTTLNTGVSTSTEPKTYILYSGQTQSEFYCLDIDQDVSEDGIKDIIDNYTPDGVVTGVLTDPSTLPIYLGGASGNASDFYSNFSNYEARFLNYDGTTATQLKRWVFPDGVTAIEDNGDEILWSGSTLDVKNIPASLVDTSKDVYGGELSSPGVNNGLNGSETCLRKPEVYELITVDNAHDYPLWFGTQLIDNGQLLEGFTNGVANEWAGTRVNNQQETTCPCGLPAQYNENIAGNTGIVNQGGSLLTIGDTYILKFKARNAKGSGGYLNDYTNANYPTQQIDDTEWTDFEVEFTAIGEGCGYGFYSDADATAGTNAIEWGSVSIAKKGDTTPVDYCYPAIEENREDKNYVYTTFDGTGKIKETIYTEPVVIT